MNKVMMKLMVAFGLMVFTICLIFLVFTISSSSKSLFEVAEENLFTVLDLWTVAISDAIEAEEFLLKTMALQPNLTDKANSIEKKLESVRENLKICESKGFLNFGLIQSDGIMHSTDGTIIDVSTEDYFTIPMQGENFISVPFISSFESSIGELIQISAVPLLVNDNPEGVLMIIKDGYVLTKLIIELEENLYGSGAIVSLETGEFLAHLDPMRVTASIIEDAKTDSSLTGFADMIASLMRRETGISRYQFYGDFNLVAYQPIPETNWGVFVYNWIDTINARTDSLAMTMMLISQIIVLVALIITYLLSKNIARSVNPPTE